MPPRWTALVVAGILVLSSSKLRADSLSTARGQALVESKHAVTLRLKDGVAHYRTRRTFANAGKQHEEVRLAIGLPVDAAAVGLRIKTPSGWFAGELMDRERAARMYQELTGFGPHEPKDPALLSWRWANELSLRVFPVPPGGASTVEYSLVAPTVYQAGRYRFSYPLVEGSSLAPPSLHVHAIHAHADVRIDGQPMGNGWRSLARTKGPTWLGDRRPAAGLGWVTSTIEVPQEVGVDSVKVELDIRHTYRGDLRVWLRAPGGRWHDLFDRGGGSQNDVRLVRELKLGGRLAAKGAWRLLVIDEAALDVGTLASWSLELGAGGRSSTVKSADTPKFIPDATGGAAGFATISMAPPPIDTIAARYGVVVASSDKRFVRFEADAAPKLRPMPKRLAVVFVVDASRSVGSVDEQLALVRSFLRHVPDADFEVVLFRRRGTRLFGKLEPAVNAPRLLEAAFKAGKLELGNGSALDAGLQLATKALTLGGAGGGRPRMIVATTDALLRPSWHNRLALPSIAAAGATLHVVLPIRQSLGGLGEVRDRRDDHHALAPLAAKGGGVLLRVEGIEGEPKEVDPVTLGLVRPVRIDLFAVRGLALPDGQHLPSVLREGEGLREMAMTPSAPGEVVIEGKIWARPFRRVVKGPLSFSRAAAAFVFSHDLHHELTPAEMMRVALAGRAVSPVTSYLAIEPGVRPSTVGLERVGTMGHGSGMGTGRAFGRGYLRMGRVGCPSFELEDVLAGAVATCAREHARSGPWKLSMVMHTTFDEVVDVVATGHRGIGSCVAEAAWQLTLPRCRFDKERDRRAASWQK